MFCKVLLYKMTEWDYEVYGWEASNATWGNNKYYCNATLCKLMAGPSGRAV